MAVALITFVSTLAISEGFPSCNLETNYVVCGFEKKTEEKVFQLRQYYSDDPDGTVLLQCELDRLETCCADNECSIVNTSDRVTIKKKIRDYNGKIGCFLLPSTTNSLNICNLTALSTSPVSAISSTSTDTPGTCVGLIQQAYIWVPVVAIIVVVVIIVVAVFGTMVLMGRIRRSKLFKISNSTQTSSSNICMQKNNISEQTSSVTLALEEVPRNDTEELLQPFISLSPQNNGHAP